MKKAQPPNIANNVLQSITKLPNFYWKIVSVHVGLQKKPLTYPRIQGYQNKIAIKCETERIIRTNSLKRNGFRIPPII